MNYWLFLLTGAFGGFVRACLGAYKGSLKIGNAKKLGLKKLIINVIASTAIGAFVGVIVDGNPVAAMTSGYMGIDIIETLFKLRKK